MVQELNYYITKYYCTCSFILGRKMFGGKRCISQGKAFDIQHSIGDNESEPTIYQIKLPLLKVGSLKLGEGLTDSSCSNWTLLTRAYIILCAHQSLLCDLKLHIPGPMTQRKHLYFTSTSSNQSSFCYVVLVPSPQGRILIHSPRWHTKVSSIFKD